MLSSVNLFNTAVSLSPLSLEAYFHLRMHPNRLAAALWAPPTLAGFTGCRALPGKGKGGEGENRERGRTDGHPNF